jgi:aminoglycoside 6'-N-acetyltransferase
MLELFHELADPESARVRRAITACGITKDVRIRNLHYDEPRAAFAAYGATRVPALYDGETLFEGAEAVIARLLRVPPVLATDRVLLRAPREADVDVLAAIGKEPAVSAFWPGLDRQVVLEHLLPPEGSVPFVIEHAGEAVGYIQYYEHDDPEFRHAGIDLFLATRLHGRGLAREAIRRLADYLFDARGHHRLVIDPAADNARAIRAYEAVGFRRVGILREYQRAPDGAWRDGLLLDMLRSDR